MSDTDNKELLSLNSNDNNDNFKDTSINDNSNNNDNSLLGKRDKLSKDIDNDEPVLKKQKLSSDNSFNLSNIYSSMICIDEGESFSICIGKDKYVYSFGRNKHGAHGHKNSFIFPPQQIEGLSNISMISCGIKHTICLDYDGNVYTFGDNSDYKLGINYDNKSDKIYTPQKVNIPPTKYIACGHEFTMCITEKGCLYSFGINHSGQLGHGTICVSVGSPNKISFWSDVSLVTCGYNFTICKNLDKYYSWGSNTIGDVLLNYNAYPKEHTDWPDNIISMKSGYYHTLLLTDEGKVYALGSNTKGQSGLNKEKHIKIPTLITDLPEIKRIECGSEHSMCIDMNDNLWVFGDNEYGQLGLGDKKNRHSPILHPSIENIIDISSGGKHTFVKKSYCEIYAFGKNNNLQIGTKTRSYQIKPLQVLDDPEDEDIWYTNIIFNSKQKSARK